MKTTKIAIFALAFLAASCASNETEYDASGVFETTEIIVSAKSQGEIMRFDVEEGQTVRALASMGYIDTTQLDLQRRQLLATRSATDSRVVSEDRQLASLRQQIANLKQERKRFEDLVKADAATQKQLDDINYQITVLERQLAASQESISSANSSLEKQSSGIDAQLAQIEQRIADCKIYSPTDGVVISKYAEPGEYAAPGRALFKVGDIENMKLRAYVSAAQVTTLKIGQEVTVYADLGEEGRKEFKGSVSWISSEAEFTPKTIQTRDERSNLVYAVKISVTNDGTIKRGMYGDVKF